MVSMKDLAAACNVSIATVSKALNDQHDVSAKTKEMVRRKAKELGYFPNSAAKTLKTNRSHNIGVLFVDEAQSGLTHDFFSNVLDSFKRTIELKDYDLTLINCSKTHSNSMSYLDRARYRGFDGVVIACIDFRDPEVIELVDSDIPVVTIDYIFNNRIAVISDNVKGMRDLVTYVYEMGHRKIAYIYGNDSSVTQARISSFFTTCSQLGIEVPEEYLRKADYRDTEGTYLRTKELLELKDPPTCILYPDDFAGFGGKERVLASLFQAVTPRTAGFNTASFSSLSGTGCMLLIVLMLIGGSPGSTAGGIKTTTVAVLLANQVAVFRRAKSPQLFGRRIEDSAVRNGATLLIMYLALPMAGAAVMSAVENLPIGSCIFETVSAIGTVGLSLGITPSLGLISRLILIALMFFGRVGGLTLMYAFLNIRSTSPSQRPVEKIAVG